MSPGGIKANLYATAQLFAILPNARQSAAENSAVNSENADTISIDSWESDSSDDAENAVRTSRTLVLSYFFRGLQGDSGILTRNTNMVHVLGNFSVLSCVDKRGILAQPMPTPETLFTFTDITVEKTEKASNDSKMENGWSDDDEVSTSTPPPISVTKPRAVYGLLLGRARPSRSIGPIDAEGTIHILSELHWGPPAEMHW